MFVRSRPYTGSIPDHCTQRLRLAPGPGPGVVSLVSLFCDLGLAGLVGVE